MFPRYLRSLSRSQSLSRSRRSRVGLVLCMIFSFNSNAEQKSGLKNLDKTIINGVLTGITAPFKNLDKALNYTAKSAENINKCEINGKITYQSKPCQK